jgi:hypothetical protein
MKRSRSATTVSGIVMLLAVLLNTVVLEQGYVSNSKWYYLLVITLPLLLITAMRLRRKSF